MPQNTNYESAVQDIEQEKKMVAALKRLSIGNMMSYDPDLPMENMEQLFRYTQTEDPPLVTPHPSSIGSVNSNHGSPTSSPNGVSSSSPTNGSPMRKRSTLSRSLSLKRQQPDDLNNESEADEFFDAEDNDHIFDSTNALLWVPANLHPEVNPDKFKIHVKSTVEEIMERKLSRKSTLSRKSSLSSSSLPNEDTSESTIQGLGDENVVQSPKEKHESYHQQQTNRFSNPSLRELTHELEHLSKLAGMDSNDAVTLARTLSTSSLGYTDVEKLAMDELTASPHSSPLHSPRRRKTIEEPLEFTEDDESFIDPESPTANKQRLMSRRDQPESSTLHLQKRLQEQFFLSQQDRDEGSQQLRQSSNSASEARDAHAKSVQDFALKRSRRPDYRKQGGSTTSPIVTSFGSSLQSSKYGKLAELRNNLQGNLIPETGSYKDSLSVKSSTTHRSFDKKNARDSQLLFSYRNPNEPSSRNSSSESLHSSRPSHQTSGSPYPNSAVPHSSVEQQFLPKYNQQNLTAKRISRIKSIQNGVDAEKSRPRQAPPTQPHPTSDLNYGYSTSSSKHRSLNQGQPESQYPSSTRQASPTEYHHLNQINSQPHTQHFPQKSHRHHHRSVNALDLSGQHQPQERPRRHHRSHRKDELQKTLHQPYVTTPTMNEKSQQLNQNLDLLRSEINEFKESLNKNDSLPVTVNKLLGPSNGVDGGRIGTVADTNDSDFSFELSYQDISYEDTLGIEKEVLGELGREHGQNAVPRQRIIDSDDDMLEGIENDLDYSDEENHRGVLYPGSKDSNNNSPRSAEINYQRERLESLLAYHEKGPFQASESSAYSAKSKLQTPPKSYRHQPQVQGFQQYGNTNDQDDFTVFTGQPASQQVREQYGVPASNRQESPYPSPTVNSVEENLKQKRLEQQLNQIELDEINHTYPSRVHHYQKVQLELPDSARSDETDRKHTIEGQPYSKQSPLISETDVSDESSLEISPTKARTQKSFGVLQNNSVTSVDTVASKSPTKKLKKKKSWSWLKERSVSLSSAEVSTLPSVAESPSRSVSTPEIFAREEEVEAKLKVRASSEGKENKISRLFKKKKPVVQASSASVHTIESKDSGVTVDYDSDTDSKKSGKKRTTGIFKKKSKAKLIERDAKETDLERLTLNTTLNSPSSEKFAIENRDSSESESHGLIDKENDLRRNASNSGKQPVQELLHSPIEDIVMSEVEKGKGDSKDKQSKKSKLKKKSNEKADHVEKEKEVVKDTEVEGVDKPQTTHEVQEKLKKSIKRTSRANQPIVFTDSAFGFPLPPPSQSTLVMLDYRFPVHVERAIYRLSHLKLANPKRSLREQVLLSNFMYAYLNLVDHTLHLEQQLTTGEAAQDGDSETEDKDLDFASDEHMLEEDNIDEIDDSDLVPSDDSIAIDLDIADIDGRNAAIEV